MVPIAMVFGGLLVILGLVLFGMAEVKSMTALIPSVFGLALIGLGLVARLGGKARMHAMHVAALIGLVGFVFPLVRALPPVFEGVFTLPVVGQLIMSALCLLFVVFCVKSFIDARRARAAKGSESQTN